jgi:hypothetical protein
MYRARYRRASWSPTTPWRIRYFERLADALAFEERLTDPPLDSVWERLSPATVEIARRRVMDQWETIR